MEAMLFVYFANILPQIGNMLEGILVVLAAGFCTWVLLGGLFCAPSVYERDRKFDWKLYKKPLYILGVPLLILCTIKPLIPNRDTMYLMAGVYVGQQVLTSDIAKDTYEIIGLEVKNILAEKKKEIQGQITEGVK